MIATEETARRFLEQKGFRRLEKKDCPANERNLVWVVEPLTHMTVYASFPQKPTFALMEEAGVAWDGKLANSSDVYLTGRTQYFHLQQDGSLVLVKESQKVVRALRSASQGTLLLETEPVLTERTFGTYRIEIFSHFQEELDAYRRLISTSERSSRSRS